MSQIIIIPKENTRFEIEPYNEKYSIVKDLESNKETAIKCALLKPTDHFVGHIKINVDDYLGINDVLLVYDYDDTTNKIIPVVDEKYRDPTYFSIQANKRKLLISGIHVDIDHVHYKDESVYLRAHEKIVEINEVLKRRCNLTIEITKYYKTTLRDSMYTNKFILGINYNNNYVAYFILEETHNKLIIIYNTPIIYKQTYYFDLLLAILIIITPSYIEQIIVASKNALYTVNDVDKIEATDKDRLITTFGENYFIVNTNKHEYNILLNIDIEKQKIAHEISNRLSRSITCPNNFYKSEVLTRQPVKRPLLTRQVSINVTNQKHGDCYAHSVSKVLVKSFRKYYPDLFKVIESIGKIKSRACEKMYLDPDIFYDCTGIKCTLDHDLKTKCNDGEYNSLILYMFIYSLIVEKFSCRGGVELPAFNYIYDIIYDELAINERCEIKQDYCEDIKQKLIQNNNDITTRNQILVPTEIKYLHSPTIFFETIQRIIEQGLYLCLSLNAIIIEFRETDEESDIPLPDQLYRIYKGGPHSVTIVDYDYDNPNNKIIIIKNSWGEKNSLVKIYEDDLNKYPFIVISNNSLCGLTWLNPENFSAHNLSLINKDITRFLTPEIDKNLLKKLIITNKLISLKSVLDYYNTRLFGSTGKTGPTGMTGETGATGPTGEYVDVLDFVIYTSFRRNNDVPIFKLVLDTIQQYKIKTFYTEYTNKIKIIYKDSPQLQEILDLFKKYIHSAYSKPIDWGSLRMQEGVEKGGKRKKSRKNRKSRKKKREKYLNGRISRRGRKSQSRK